MGGTGVSWGEVRERPDKVLRRLRPLEMLPPDRPDPKPVTRSGPGQGLRAEVIPQKCLCIWLTLLQPLGFPAPSQDHTDHLGLLCLFPWNVAILFFSFRKFTWEASSRDLIPQNVHLTSQLKAASSCRGFCFQTTCPPNSW